MANGSRSSGPRRLRPRQIVAGALDGVLPSTARPATPWAANGAGDDYGAPAEPDWRAIDWRDHVREMTVEGTRVRYAELGAGDGPPLVFVHGLGGNWQNWLENMPAAARGRRVLALDLPGFGDSEMPRDDISISGFARTVDAFAEALGLGRVDRSSATRWAASSAAELGDPFPRARGAARAGRGGRHLDHEPRADGPRSRSRGSTRPLSASTVARRRELIVRPRLRHAALSFVFRHPRRMPADLLFEVLQGTGKRGFMPALNALLSYDFRDRLPEIACPTLVVWGSDDMLVPLRDADEYERLSRGSRKVVMEDTGHVPMMERPRAFNEPSRGVHRRVGNRRHPDRCPRRAADGPGQ